MHAMLAVVGLLGSVMLDTVVVDSIVLVNVLLLDSMVLDPVVLDSVVLVDMLLLDSVVLDTVLLDSVVLVSVVLLGSVVLDPVVLDSVVLVRCAGVQMLTGCGIREPLKELDRQFVTFVLFTHPENPLLADGQGNVAKPEPA